ncbi:hypothetical protein XBO1_1980015 [Xenorhabdus bovienii str. oregonense]|uniref:HTH lysR-type domain-containing protein n=2 Tax=Xenorhabdus bovienii TaxID=40576 RepID=A0A077P3Q9_XENBV|nr:LysR family transcriptional regulator [Xenorhabdus bovienii]CDH05685.1 hypothetical protein XBO1_1980015 [Xenorhabdus bovienii str. oregonense]
MLSTHEYANDLILFALIVDCGSFSKAAESAGITSLAISKRIGRLGKSLANPQSCIGCGFGIAMVPRVMVYEDLQTGKLVEILKGYSGKVLGVYAVYPYTRNLPLKIRLLIEHIMISYKNISHYF